MSSNDKYKRIGQSKFVQKRYDGNNKTNNIKAYSVQKVVVEKSIKTSYNTNGNNYQKAGSKQTTTSDYQTKSKFPVTQNKSQNNYISQSNDVKIYEYTAGNVSNVSSVNLKHHPNQLNNLIHNHKFYTSNTANTQKTAKTSHTVTSTRSERSQRTQSLSPFGKSKYIVETKKVELYGKQRNSSASDSSKETNVSISKTQIRKLMTNLWLEEMYCSNVESLCCLVDKDDTNRSNNSIEMYEKELEQKDLLIKDYEAEILKLKSALNIKEQEMKKLALNLKQSENTLKIKNQKIYELNTKTVTKNESLDKDTHELQIISTKDKNRNEELDRDAHSLQIISMKKGWNDIIIPSPVNEIYIQTVINAENYAEMMRIKKRREEEEEIRRKKIEKIANFEIQEMGLLSIITKKPKKINLCQHLESIMILSKVKTAPLKFQKIEEINVTSEKIKSQNEIQELDGLEILHYKKKKRLEQQCLNGLEIQREYDMLLVKPKWNSLKIQGTGLNLLAIPREPELENQEIDEIELRGKEKPEKIQILVPVVPNNIQKTSYFKILGKVKKKVEYKIKRERLKFDGIEKEETDWNELNMPIMTTKLLLRRNYEKVKPKKEIKWDEIVKPIKSGKLYIRGIIKLVKKAPVLKMVKIDKFKFIHSAPVKEIEEFDIENSDLNLLSPKKKVKKILRIAKGGFGIKGKEKQKISLIKNKMDSINLYGLIKTNVILPSSTQYITLAGEKIEKIEENKNWNDYNKVMKTRDLNIPKKKQIANRISKKVVNVEIKSSKQLILKPIKTTKLFIKSIPKKIIKKPSLKLLREGQLFIRSIKKVEIIEKKPEIILKPIKENKLFIKGIKKVVIEMPKMKVINWNDLIKVEKKPGIDIINKVKKVIFKKQGLNSFCLRGIKQIERKPSEKIEVKYDWSNLLKAQRNVKFTVKGKTKSLKLVAVKGEKVSYKKEPEEEIIYNDDYNYLNKKKENGKEQKEKLVVIKEKEIVPTVHREIRAQVIRVKEDSSETSSQSDVDVLAGIKRQGTMTITGAKSGYNKQIINGEVIFTPKVNLGVNLGGAKYKKEIKTKKGIIINNTETGRASGIEINASNGEVYYEKMSGIGGAIREGSYKVINGSSKGTIKRKKLKNVCQSTTNMLISQKKLGEPNDSIKKNIKKQLIVKSSVKTGNRNESLTSGNIISGQNIYGNMENEGTKQIIFNSNLNSGNIKHSASTFGLRQEKGKIITVKKEEYYTYEHKDNGNLIDKEQ